MKLPSASKTDRERSGSPSPDPGSPAFRPARQKRSQDTLRRLLEAASTLLDDKTFDEITVTEIVERADSSVGAFYARFSDKDALLDHLGRRYHEILITRVAEMTDERNGSVKDPKPQDREHPERGIRRMMAALVRLHREQRGLVRALILRERSRSREGATGGAGKTHEILVLAERLLTQRKRITHPNPELAAYLAILMVFGAIRERLIFPASGTGPIPITDAILTEELTDMCLGYLGVQRGRE
jgi:AcrR family transcriptional regulator